MTTPRRWIFSSAKLRDEREQRAWSQADLAARAGISKKTVTFLENGHHVARPATVQLLAGALGIAPRRLLVASKDAA